MHGTFSETDHMISHKTSLSKFKVKLYQVSFSYRSNNIKLEINRGTLFFFKYVEINTLLNNQWNTEKGKEKKKKIFKQMKIETRHTKTYEMQRYF